VFECVLVCVFACLGLVCRCGVCCGAVLGRMRLSIVRAAWSGLCSGGVMSMSVLVGVVWKVWIMVCGLVSRLVAG
jgi:hypothetical protein